jgi:hypothetical protein
VTGVLRACEAGWCVDRTPLDFGPKADLTTRQGDFNGDGKIRSMERELRSLEGRTMTLTVVDEPAPVNPQHANRRHHSGAGSAPVVVAHPSPAPAPVSDHEAHQKHRVPPLVAITLDADGLVASINGAAYSAP